jgi:hypothetical protein
LTTLPSLYVWSTGKFSMSTGAGNAVSTGLLVQTGLT